VLPYEYQSVGESFMLSFVFFATFQAAAVTGVTPVATGAPAAPVAAPAVSAAPTAVASNPDTKIICKEEETTGTRLGGHKVCMTRAQWRANAAQDRDTVKHSQENIGYRHQ
jgi:hypothetical protein